MADNTILSTNVGTGNTIRTLEDGSSIHWPAGVTAYATTVGTPDVLQVVTPTAGLPVQQQTGATFTIVGTGTFVAQVSGDALTALQLLDDIVTVRGVAGTSTDKGVPVWAMRNDAGAGFVNVADGDHSPISVDEAGRVGICDLGGSITVDGTVAVSGTVTVGSHAVTNAGTFAVQAAQSGTWNITNISGTVSLPTGAATAAKQPALGTAGTASADVITVQGIASMTALKVDGSAVTQPVSDGGSTLSVDDGGGSLTVDGSVSVSGLVPGTSATSLGKAEDAAAADGDTGVAVWAVRKDTAATTVGADGDYHPFEVDGNGRLWVNGSSVTQPVSDAGGSLTVDNGGTFAVQAAQSGTWTVTGTGGTFPVTDSGGSLTVDNGGTFAVQVDGTALTRLTDIETNTDSLAVVGNGAAATAQRVTIANDSTGILAGVTTVTTVTTCGTVTTLTGGGVAHDGADSGNPHKIGAKANTALNDNTLVADADRTDLMADLDGVLINRDDAPLGDTVTGQAAITDGSSTSVIAAAGAGVKNYITDVTIANSSASNVTVDLRDGTAGSVKWTFPVPANGGVVYTFKRPLPFSANTAVAADPSAAASTVTVSLGGFKSKV